MNDEERIAELKRAAIIERIKYDGHADRVEYGWWERKRGHVHLPDTLGDERNFVLRYEDLKTYKAVLDSAKAMIDAETMQVNITLRALETGIARSWDTKDPKVYTLAHVLESLVVFSKIKLSIMNWSIDVLKERLVRVPKTNKGEQT